MPWRPTLLLDRTPLARPDASLPRASRRPDAIGRLGPFLRAPRLSLTLFCLLLWTPGLFSLPPGDRDESRFVQGTKQMIETGDFVRIRNGEEERNRKPIGIHWLQLPFAAAARDAGLAHANPVWPYRLPSLLGGIIAVLLTHAIGLRLFGRREGFIAGAMLAACLILSVETHIAKTDAALLAATAAAMLPLARAYLDPGGVRRRDAALFWLALGAGVLLKGPIAPMVAGLVALVLSAADRRARWLLALRPAWGVPLLLACVVPWFVAIGVATDGRFFRDAVGGDLGRKLASGDDAHWGPPGLHLLLLPLLLFPASLPVLRALPAAWQARGEPATRFLLAWIVPAWIVFEAAPTKLPHYTMPLYPALVLLGARWLLSAATDGVGTPSAARWRWWPRASGALLVLAAAALGAAAAALPPFLGAPWWLGLPGLAAAGLLAWLALRRGVGLALLAAPLLYWSVLQLELPNVPALWIAPRAVAALQDAAAAPGAPLGAVGFHEPSLRFLGGTDALFLPNGWEGARALAERRVGVLLVGDRDLAAFQAEAARLGIVPRAAVAPIRGFNYSRGRWVELTLFR